MSVVNSDIDGTEGGPTPFEFALAGVVPPGNQRASSLGIVEDMWQLAAEIPEVPVVSSDLRNYLEASGRRALRGDRLAALARTTSRATPSEGAFIDITPIELQAQPTVEFDPLPIDGLGTEPSPAADGTEPQVLEPAGPTDGRPAAGGATAHDPRVDGEPMDADPGDGERPGDDEPPGHRAEEPIGDPPDDAGAADAVAWASDHDPEPSPAADGRDGGADGGDTGGGRAGDRVGEGSEDRDDASEILARAISTASLRLPNGRFGPGTRETGERSGRPLDQVDPDPTAPEAAGATVGDRRAALVPTNHPLVPVSPVVTPGADEGEGPRRRRGLPVALAGLALAGVVAIAGLWWSGTRVPVIPIRAEASSTSTSMSAPGNDGDDRSVAPRPTSEPNVSGEPSSLRFPSTTAVSTGFDPDPVLAPPGRTSTDGPTPTTAATTSITSTSITSTTTTTASTTTTTASTTSTSTASTSTTTSQALAYIGDQVSYGTWDGPGVANVRVELWADDDRDRSADRRIGTVTTTTTGRYSFDVPAGCYEVRFIPPAPYRIPPDQATQYHCLEPGGVAARVDAVAQFDPAANGS